MRANSVYYVLYDKKTDKFVKNPNTTMSETDYTDNISKARYFPTYSSAKLSMLEMPKHITSNPNIEVRQFFIRA